MDCALRSMGASGWNTDEKTRQYPLGWMSLDRKQSLYRTKGSHSLTLYQTRLTFNYWRKGGYSVGSEDYRWEIIRQKVPAPLFFVFNVLFISTAQSVRFRCSLCLLTTY